MVIVLHVISALITLVTATWLYVKPSVAKFRGVYISLAATVLSGTALIFLNNVSLIRTCLVGLFYLGAVTYVIAVSKQKFARQTNISK